MKHPFVVATALLAVVAHSSEAADGRRKPRDPAAVERLQTETGAEVAISDATGGARFVRAPKGKALGLQRAATAQAKAEETMTFLERHGRAFGLSDARAALKLERSATDRKGQTHLSYLQEYFGVPVFGAALRAHFDADGNLTSVNGNVLPDLDVNIAPTRSTEDASAAALKHIEAASDVTVRGSRLLIFREGLAKGVPGADHLAYEIEAGNGGDVREFVYVDAHTGKVIDRISGIHENLNRRAFNAQGATAPGPNYPNNPFWVEGDPFPTASNEANNMIAASKETYDLFANGFSRDSFDGGGATMDSIFNRGNGCPNASWNGIFISFCPGTTSDDVTAHEWGHAYTQYTHNLIYAWQPGALNESYSDIWGEVVDFMNGRQTDSPGGPRTADSCTAYTRLPAQLVVNAPAAIAGAKLAQVAQFGPNLTPAGTTGNVVLGLDPANAAGPSTTDGCSTFTNPAAVAGNVALLDRGTCNFSAKVYNAQLAGAIGVIIANNAASGLPGMGAGVNANLVTIPSLGISLADGNAIKAQLGVGVNATIRANFNGPVDNSYRWLMGEDATAFGGAIRDMWNPTCYGNPGKVGDTAQYVCSTADGGGVHTNSGVPNHGFALLVDGGTYNGQTVGAIGMTKAAHIYFRAMDVYQHAASDFADHADALEQSCADLTGDNLPDLATGAPSGQVISASDCAQVAAAIAAVELRTPPTQCNFQPLLAQNPPPLCSTGFASHLFHDSFEAGNSSTARWSASHSGITADFTPRYWQVVGDLPDDRAGRAFFGPNPDIGTCAPGGDETAVLHLVSPQIVIPSSVTDARLTFDHWVATEPGWDGGNLKISVNGGPWQLVQPADFVYNAYNTTLVAAGGGNTNPIAGEPAFSGTDGGAVDGSWGRSLVNLAPYAGPGSKVRLRFDIGNDGCTGRFGWYLDDVMVYTCRGN